MELGFTLAFMAEALIRLASYFPEWKSFFNETRNRTDLLIAVVTCIIQLPPIHGNSIAYSWLTGFQIIRIYRVLVAFPRMRAIISRILGSVYGLMNLVFFVVLVTLICGMVVSFSLVSLNVAICFAVNMCIPITGNTTFGRVHECQWRRNEILLCI